MVLTFYVGYVALWLSIFNLMLSITAFIASLRAYIAIKRRKRL